MDMHDMILVSVDDHLCEPPDMFDARVLAPHDAVGGLLAVVTAPTCSTPEFWRHMVMISVTPAGGRDRPNMFDARVLAPHGDDIGDASRRS